MPAFVCPTDAFQTPRALRKPGSGKSKWELSNGLSRPLSAKVSTIVYNCALFCGLFGPLFQGNFRRKMPTIVGNRGQLFCGQGP